MKATDVAWKVTGFLLVQIIPELITVANWASKTPVPSKATLVALILFHPPWISARGANVPSVTLSSDVAEDERSA